MKTNHINKIVKIAGSQESLARKINQFIPINIKPVSQKRVSDWVNGKFDIPPKYIRAIEKAVDGEVTRYQLAPDVFGEDPALKSEQVA